MAKKIALFVLILVGLSFVAIAGYRMVSPEIAVANESSSAIDEAVIQLPSNRVVFGEILPGSESSIYYSVSQADGTYNYSVSLSDGNRLSGTCGYVTNSQYGKRLRLVVNSNEEIECQESSKIPWARSGEI
jgi:hypothetical protein